LPKSLDFEKPIIDLHLKIQQLKNLAHAENLNLDDEIQQILNRASLLKKEIYASLSPSQIIQIARHPNRPDTLSLIRLISDSFTQFHGDRLFKDDPSIVGGLASISGTYAMLIGHQKGHDTKENIYRNFGMPHPEGYRKALRLMHMANKFSLPIVTFIDTPGAYPGIEAEERGQAEAIARNLKEMAGLDVPVLTYVIGEGGSGGALAIGVCNQLMMLEYAVYSVISPEGCASILFRDAKLSDRAAKAMKMTAKDICDLGVADGIIPEPPGGAHHDWEWIASSIKENILAHLNVYKTKTPQEVRNERYQKFRKMGSFKE